MIAFRSLTVGPGTPSELKLLLFLLCFHLNIWLCIHKLRNVWGGFSQSLIDELTHPQLGCQPASWGYSCLLRSLFFLRCIDGMEAIPEWDLYWLWSLPLQAGGALGTGAGESSEVGWMMKLWRKKLPNAKQFPPLAPSSTPTSCSDKLEAASCQSWSLNQSRRAVLRSRLRAICKQADSSEAKCNI